MNKAQLEQAAEIALQQAKQQGATSAEVGVSHSSGLSVSVRQGDVETLEHNNDKGLGITVYFGQTKASASTSDFTEQAIADTVAAACGIAKHTQDDEFAGLADADLMATEFPDLSLYHPWQLDAGKAIEIAAECEQAGFDFDSRINNSEGASVSSHQGWRVYANSHGFNASSQSSRHGISSTLIADDDKGMQRDYWYSSARDAADLESAVAIGQRAAENTLSRLNAKTVKTGSYPVIFAAKVAPSLFGQLIGGISGGALYRKSTFLLDHLGKKIFPDFVHIHEQPYLLKGLGSSAFDGEGVTTQTRDIIKDGVLQGYVLSSYSARKLNMATTANSGGVHNLTVDSGDLDLAALIKKMGTGILVTETMGMGVNMVTGDYSQGAAGFWVENGEIQYAIDEFTIASNLADMFLGIQAISNDVEIRGNTRTGSVLIDNMKIAS
ncbi:MAG: metalloprotease PmbA [Gammaproteobacteria bacterium]|nr:MAG: metalloprotease PmbA [Gammaproteobacteria bacterium]